MRKVRSVHLLSWFATDSSSADTSYRSQEQNHHCRCSGFLDCLEGKLWPGSHSRANHSAVCRRSACSTWGQAHRSTSSQFHLHSLAKKNLFQDQGCDLLPGAPFLQHCLHFVGSESWENRVTVTWPTGGAENSLTALSHALLPWASHAWKAVLCCLFIGLVEVMMHLNSMCSFHLTAALCFPI